MQKVYLTPEGFERLRKELEHLKGARRREVAHAIQVARELGDLSENAEYDAAKEEQAKLELRIHHMEDQLAHAQILDKAHLPEGKISLGQRVRLKDIAASEELEYELVSPAESDFNAGRISVTSPIGKGLIGRQVGEEVEIRIPAGVRRYQVLAIEPM